VKATLAKGLELLGLAIVGAGLLYGLGHEHGLKVELALLGVGGLVFAVGWLIERRGGEAA
jgi:membrane protease YdiL (CAAX protease family)